MFRMFYNLDLFSLVIMCSFKRISKNLKTSSFNFDTFDFITLAVLKNFSKYYIVIVSL